jgi:signal transduction histidine kinase
VAEELSRSLDLDEVLGRCLDLAIEAAHAAAGVIYLHEPEHKRFRRVIVRRLSDEEAEPLLNAEGLMNALAGASLELPLQPDSPQAMVRAAWKSGIRRVVMLALRGDEARLVGFIAVHFTETAPQGSTLRTLEAIARQGAFAIANARAHQIVERRARLAVGLRELTERALSCADAGTLHRTILDGAMQLTRSDRGLVAQVFGDVVRVMATTAEGLLGTEMPIAVPYIAEGLSTVIQVHEDATQIDPTSPIGQAVKERGTRSMMTAGIRHAGRPLGLLFVSSNQPRRWEPEEREVLPILAAMAGDALERLSALERLEAEKRRLDAVLEHVPVAISVMERHGRRLHTNRAARQITETLGVAGDGWREGLSRIQVLDREGKLVPEESTPLMRAFAGETPPPTDLMLVGNKRLHIVATAVPLLDAQGNVEAVVSAMQDVTALRELADVKDHFLRVASHELRSPLTSLRATTSLLEMDPSAIEDPERRTLLLERVQRQVSRLTRLGEQLIDSVRLSSVEPPLERAPMDLAALCREVIDELPDGSRVMLESESAVRGTWDALRLEQVLSNLLSNAMRYSQEAVRVRLRGDGKTVTLEVIDRGIGIPPVEIDHLFMPFFRASNAPTHSKGGLGLGLHIAHEIVRRHGGTLTVRSALGEGSTFTMVLPVDTGPPAG